MVALTNEEFVEIARLLMRQVHEEQRARLECVSGKEDRTPIAVPNDVEVSERIKELQEVAKKVLTKNTSGGKI